MESLLLLVGCLAVVVLMVLVYEIFTTPGSLGILMGGFDCTADVAVDSYHYRGSGVIGREIGVTCTGRLDVSGSGVDLPSGF